MITSNPYKFAEWFNYKYPGAYRQLTFEDVKHLTDCGLIPRYGYYSGSIDGELIRRIVQYEQLRENRSANQDKEKKLLICKSCGQPLVPNPESKPGRPKEYCSECESFRNKERQRKARQLRIK